MRHDLRREGLAALFVVSVGIDQQLNTRILVSPDQVDSLGHFTNKAGRRFSSRAPLALGALRGHCGIVAGE